MIAEYEKKGIKVIHSGKFDEDDYYDLDTEPHIRNVLELGNAGKIRPGQRRLFIGINGSPRRSFRPMHLIIGNPR
jgi:hypothetical protein